MQNKNNMITKSSKWRNTIKIKHLFQDHATPELVTELCKSLISQLHFIQKREAASNLTDDEKYNIDTKLEESIDHFEFLRDLANGTIPESEWKDYDFDGDHEEMFNDYLTELYDIGDERVRTKQDILEKFIWIE